jgi:hypothetical protein
MIKFHAVAAALVAFILHSGPAGAQQPHNVVLFVPDGLRALLVTPETAPPWQRCAIRA